MNELTSGILEEWQQGYKDGEDVPDWVMEEMFSLALEKLKEIEAI